MMRYSTITTMSVRVAQRQHLMKPLRIAIADDNWFVAQHLRGELATLGHIVVGLARTAQELVELVARERPDLALVDIRLADGSDGTGCCERDPKELCRTDDCRDRTPYGRRGEGSGPLGAVEQALHSAGLRTILEAAADWLERGTSRPFLVR
jgi:hypothetical protein